MTTAMGSRSCFEVIYLTPELAKKWLGQNTRNRRIRRSKVDLYARDMANGRWQFNGDPFRFDERGVLLDGQHRCMAVVNSGATIKALVVHGLDTAAQDTMDIGSARLMADQLQLRGETQSALLGSVLRRVVLHKAGVRVPGGGLGNPTHAELADFLSRNPGVRRAVDVAGMGRNRVRATSTALGTAYFLCAELDRDQADHFYVEQLVENVGLRPSDPALILSRRLGDLAGDRRVAPTEDGLRFMLLAWNVYRSGRRITRLQAPRGGWTSDNFPEPK
jgi:hypothetical protein